MKNSSRKLRGSIFAIGLSPILGGIFAWQVISAPTPSPGKNTFKAKCAACHGPEGAANTPFGKRLKIRDLRSPEVQKQTDDELTAIITNGKPPMPAFGKTLSTEEIRQLVAYIRSIATKG